MASKSKKKTPASSSDGHESRRWREGAAGREIALGLLSVQLLPKTKSYELPRRSARKKDKTGPAFNAMGSRNGRYKHGAYCIGAPEAVRKAAVTERSRKSRAKRARLN